MVDQWLIPLGLPITVLLVLCVMLLRLWKKQDVWSLLLHGMAVLLMGFVLLGPITLNDAGSRGGPMTCAALVDRSQSMSLRDEGQRTRLQMVCEDDLSPRQLNASPVLDWRLFTFADQTQPRPVTDWADCVADGQGTNLLVSLAKLDEQLPAKIPIVVFSDGNDTQGSGLDALLSSRIASRPIHVMPLGTAVKQPTLHAYAWTEPSVVTIGQTVDWHLMLDGLWTLPAGQTVHVTLRDQDRVIARYEVKASQAGSIQRTFTSRFSKPALTTWTWQVDAGDTTPKLNAVAIAQCVQAPVKVLLLEGNPHWFSRNAARAIRMDDQLHLTARYALGQTRELQLSDSKEAQAPDQMDWQDRDVIVLGRGADAMFNEAMRQQLADWVHAGGGLLWLRGWQVNREVWPSALLPDQIMDAGELHTLVGQLSLPLRGGESMQTLLRAKRLGQGRIIRLDESQLALSAVPSRSVDDLIVRLIGYLAKPLTAGQGRWADMQLDRHATRVGDSVAVTLTVRDAVPPQLELTRPDGTHESVTVEPVPGNHLKWQTRIPVKQPGLHTLTLLLHDHLQQAFVARPQTDEMMHVIPNHDLLKAIAHQTGGKVFTSSSTMFETLKQQRDQRISKQATPIQVDRFNQPLLVLTIISLWLAGWSVSRRKGGV